MERVKLGRFDKSPLLKYRAPISFLLHKEELKWNPTSHSPFHLDGTELIPWSLKLSLSGQIPLSTSPMITSFP
ncbi:hypothetical protein HanOQP8_Chr02g0046851 [Helianthus annuus]|nr:hypothetical protein HanOQP8_Chr02g0046851 [Helianthus annuus]